MDLRLGDCLDLLDSLPDKSVDILYTDAPYIPPEHKKTLTKYPKTLSEMGVLEGFYKTYLKKILVFRYIIKHFFKIYHF